MIRIVVSLREKRSTQSQFENISIGCDLEANNLELNTPEEIVGKTRQLFQMARAAVQGELLKAIPEHAEPQRPVATNGHTNGNGASNGNDHANGHTNGNGHAAPNSRRFGRPNPEATAKQKVLVQKLAQERGLSAEAVGEMSRREFGCGVPLLNKNDVSKLIEMLMAQPVSP